MGRFYEITLTPGPTSPPDAKPTQWSSIWSGATDPGALNIEFDFFSFQSPESQASHGLSTLTIHGIALGDLFQASQFVGSSITVKAGMSPGLPLASPAQAGTILQGQIFQSFGNWIGTEMTLDFVINFADFTYAEPGNIVLNWPKGTSLADALTVCLNTAYPTLPISVNIGSQYVLGHDVLHAVNTLPQLQNVVRSLTKAIQPPGVGITIQPNKSIEVFDGSKPSQTKVINFTDLVGQPTWIDQNVMQVTTVMRGDVQVNTEIAMPPGLTSAPGAVTVSGQSLPSSMKYQTSFQGKFIVTSVRHVGNFRDPNGTSWVSIFRCAPQSVFGG